MQLTETFHVQRPKFVPNNADVVMLTLDSNDDRRIQYAYHNEQDAEGKSIRRIATEHKATWNKNKAYWFWNIDAIRQAENLTRDEVINKYIRPCLEILNSKTMAYKDYDYADFNRVMDQELVNIKGKIVQDMQATVNDMKNVEPQAPVGVQNNGRVAAAEEDIEQTVIDRYKGILDDIMQVTSTEEYKQMLEKYIEFGKNVSCMKNGKVISLLDMYSMTNVMLIYAQRPNATFVACASDFEDAGNRRPKPGVEAIWLYVKIGEHAHDIDNRVQGIKNDFGVVKKGENAVADVYMRKATRAREGNQTQLMPYFYDISDTEVIPGKADGFKDFIGAKPVVDDSNATKESTYWFNIVAELLYMRGLLFEEDYKRMLKDSKTELANVLNANGDLADAGNEQVKNMNNEFVRKNLNATKDLLRKYAMDMLLMDDKYNKEKGIQAPINYREHNTDIDSSQYLRAKSEMVAFTVMRRLGFNNVPNEADNLAAANVTDDDVRRFFRNLIPISERIIEQIKEIVAKNKMNNANVRKAGVGRRRIAQPANLNAVQESVMHRIYNRKNLTEHDIASCYGFGDRYAKAILEEANDIKREFFNIFESIR